MSPKMINNQCSNLDIFPTIAEMTLYDTDKDCNNILGQSLFKMIMDLNPEDREVFVETGGLHGYWPSPKKHNVFCVRNNNKKLIYNDTPQTWEFYDISNDPQENQNLYDENSDDVHTFKNRLLHYLNTLQIKTKLTN